MIHHLGCSLGYEQVCNVSRDTECSILDGLARQSSVELSSPLLMLLMALTVLRQCIFHFEKAKFSSYIRTVTHYILGGIIKIKFSVNSESEVILSCLFVWMFLPCFLHHVYLSSFY